MALLVVEAVPADIKPPAADDSMHTPWVENTTWRFSAFVDQGVTDAFSRSRRRFGYFAEAGQTLGPSSTLAGELSPSFARSAVAPFVRLRVFVSGSA